MGKKEIMGKPKRKESKLKWTLNYDEKEQKDYLLGMRKRKDERRKKAKEEKKELVKEMQRNLRKEKLDFVKNRVKKVKHLLPSNIRANDDDDDEDDDDEDDNEDEATKTGTGYSVDGYKKKSMELFQKLQKIEGKHINKKQMFLQRKQKKKLLRKLKRKPQKGAGRNK